MTEHKESSAVVRDVFQEKYNEGFKDGYAQALKDQEERLKTYCHCAVNYRSAEEKKSGKCEDCNGLIKLDK